MSAQKEHMDILQNLEFAVVRVWKHHPEMTDHVVARAYEAAFERYRAEARGNQPKPAKLTGVDQSVYNAVTEMCEYRLGRNNVDGQPSDELSRVPVAVVMDCLRELRKSVERHTKHSGRQGCLTFVSQFV